ncbi:MAG: LuxR C-terminal-related transcriptional regulator [Thermoanaerobaculales bacterium]|nr:LuxR C-terminal-related transcriptional regulator [Thermoanaerobaculales bacterium]
MGAKHPIVLEPQCPAQDDPGIVSFMRLARALTQASWVELELRPSGASPSQTYRFGSGTGKPITLNLDAGIEFDASLRLGTAKQPEKDLITLLSDSLERALEFRSLLIQTDLLSRALDTTSSSVLLFDSEGGILFANPSADHLLSQQTEDQLLGSCNNRPRQPLFTLLSSLVERVATRDGTDFSWAGTIELAEGRTMACEVTAVPVPADDGPEAVLVTLQPTESESGTRIQVFSSSHGLSPREQEVLHLLGRGLTTTAMAEELGISPHTIRDHLKNLYRKTGTKGRNELLGLISRAS